LKKKMLKYDPWASCCANYKDAVWR
jgi:hypothetical protein